MSYTYEDKLNFVVSIYCIVRKVSFETGLSWKTMLAQAVEETGWGEKILDGTNNIYNIKKYPKWKGPTKTFNVHEDNTQRRYYMNSPFCVYASIEAAVYGRVHFLKANPRYSKLFSKDVLGNFEKEAQVIEDSGYATVRDKQTKELIYADNLINIFNGRSMRRSISRAKQKSNCAVTAAQVKENGILAANKEVEISLDGKKYVTKTTNDKAIIEGITTGFNQSVYFKIENEIAKATLDGKREQAVLVDNFSGKFESSTRLHDVKQTDNKNKDANVSESSQKQSEEKPKDVTFSIKLVEEDTSKAIPNFKYSLKYKGKPKPHQTNGSGIESGIVAETGNTIDVLFDDDDKLTQTIHSFTVEEKLDGKTVTINIPVVSIEWVITGAGKPLVNYNAHVTYRSKTKKKRTNSQGIIKLKALTGQKLKLFTEHGEHIHSRIVTKGNTQWTSTIHMHKFKVITCNNKAMRQAMSITVMGDDKRSYKIQSDKQGEAVVTAPRGSNVLLRTKYGQSSVKVTGKLKIAIVARKESARSVSEHEDKEIAVEDIHQSKKSPSSQSDAKLSKRAGQDNTPKVTRKEIEITDGPTSKVESTDVKFTVQFLDEKTRKPISGYGYILKSTDSKTKKRRKRNHSSGSEGKKTHSTFVGDTIDVLIFDKNGKEINKDSFKVQRSMGVKQYYVPKPVVPNIPVLFNGVKSDRKDIVTQKTKNILAQLAAEAGMPRIYITSTLRTPEEQVNAMWGKRSLYGPVGRAVHDIGSKYAKFGPAGRKKEMAKEIRRYQAMGKKTSNHCVSREQYSKKNVVDIGNVTNKLAYGKGKNKKATALGKKFHRACNNAVASGKVHKYIPGHKGSEGAFHLEIKQ